jgi:hypothetical protein
LKKFEVEKVSTTTTEDGSVLRFMVTLGECSGEFGGKHVATVE